MNPFRWLRDSRARNLAEYEASQPSPASLAASALAKHGARKRKAPYDALRRAVVDEMRAAQGKAPWRWSNAS